MKHLEQYEDSKPTFKDGDYVKCVKPPINDSLERNKIYIVDHADNYTSRIFIKYRKISNGYYTYRFIPATPEEIEQYEFTININKYNL